MNRKNLALIAEETIDIIDKGKYIINGKEIRLDSEKNRNVKVYSLKYQPKEFKKNDKKAKIIVKPAGSFETLDLCDIQGKTCVLNFASAKNPGGGFQNGAKAQEEQLCYCSTLFASIGSEKAFEMYKYNREHYNTLYSDYMLYSPYVEVFRDSKSYEFLEKTKTVSVITAPAVNRNIADSKHSNKEIFECMLNRAEKILSITAENGNSNIVLGAWGCGVFRNSVEDIAEIFRILLFEKNYISLFDNVIFASFNDKNADIFSKILSL